MDAGIAALLGAGVTGLVAIVLAVAGPLVGARVSRRERTRDDLRAFRLGQVDRAERALLLQLLTLEAIADRDLARARALVAEAAELPAADTLMLGDAGAVRSLVAAETPLAARLRPGLVGSTISWLTGLNASRAERQALTDAKTAVHRAFDAQRERVIAGKTVVLVDVAVSRAILDANPAVQDFMARWAVPDEPVPPADRPAVDTLQPAPARRVGRWRRPGRWLPGRGL